MNAGWGGGMGRRRTWTDEQVQRICLMIREGHTVLEIARLEQVSRQRIYQLLPPGTLTPPERADRVGVYVQVGTGAATLLAAWSEQHGLSRPEIIRRLLAGQARVAGDDLQLDT